jgi:hypothetical protein
MDTIPVIDIAPFLNGNEKAKRLWHVKSTTPVPRWAS